MTAEICGTLTPNVVSSVSSAALGNYYSAVSAALVVYDHICTIPAEVQFMWGRKLAVSMALFHANRWLVMIFTILEIVEGFTLSAGTFVYYVVNMLEMCLIILWTVFSTTRVYALSGGNRFLWITVALLSLVPVGANAYCLVLSNSWQLVAFRLLGRECFDSQLDITEGVCVRFSIGARACVIVADLIVLSVTWSKTWTTVNAAYVQNVKTPLMTMLLRDGTLNFLVSKERIVCLPQDIATGVHMFQHVIDTLTDGLGHDISRPSFVRDGGLDPVTSHVSSLRFVSFVGNLGESLVDGSENDDLDVVWDEDTAQEQPSSSAEFVYNPRSAYTPCICRHSP
ncbi:hypothetical protein CERSUDRAFT_73341 [Gelatoporia subvermispora B]|uniref:DUF6533 domain-containing protein n=1 Tax=Ceriporiopsis subvermispora (strain B) TaxID=914234 RepID=M2RF84_CERS8|nr:hypothetical protein CERSUDRAFT_73341 [Gelatoporia subvermispora B]